MVAFRELEPERQYHPPCARTRHDILHATSLPRAVFLDQIVGCPTHPFLCSARRPHHRVTHFQGSDVCIIPKEKRRVVAEYFFEENVLLAIPARRNQMRVVAPRFVVHSGSRLSYDLVGEAWMQNPAVYPMA